MAASSLDLTGMSAPKDRVVQEWGLKSLFLFLYLPHGALMYIRWSCIRSCIRGVATTHGKRAVQLVEN